MKFQTFLGIQNIIIFLNPLKDCAMNISDRRLINLFKTFVEKVFVPHFNKLEMGVQQEWTKFSNMVSVDQINLGELQVYVDTLPSFGSFNNSSFERRNKSPGFGRSKKDPSNEQIGSFQGGFNPNKTFGGARTKGPLFPMSTDFEEPQKREYNFNKQFSRDVIKEEKEKQAITTQNILPSLERLFKSFSENHQKLEKLPTSGLIQPMNTYEGKNYYM